jgi:three-Cys-motif partner protein
MADTLPTTWPAEPHTLAKHAILDRYLKAWFPILSRQAATIARLTGNSSKREILFIDGFAGPGEYTTGERGSPVIALESAANHSASFPIPVRMLFIESRPDRFAHLTSVLSPHISRIGNSKNIHAVEPRPGDCDSVLSELLDSYEKNGISFGPALAFLDQFGYGEVPMSLISRILAIPQCEVFSYLDYKDMNRWITDPGKASAFTRAYGGEEWRGAINLPENQRRHFLLDQYKNALKARGRSKYVTSFSMFDINKKPLYWLIFCTNNLRGLEEMKKAMWAVDETGAFQFSDSDDPSQLGLFSVRFDQSWLAETLAERLAGQTLSYNKVREYVLTETPCYLLKNALRSLEIGERKDTIKVKSPDDRKPGTYPDDIHARIEFTFAKRPASLFQ